MSAIDIRGDAFPARRKAVTGPVSGTSTDITRVDFSDKILVTISQGGRLSHWVSHLIFTRLTHIRPTICEMFHSRGTLLAYHKVTIRQVQVPLESSSSGVVEMSLSTPAKQNLLPSTHLTPRTLLGGGGEQRDTLCQLYAAQIASRIALSAPDDRRTLVLGLGLELDRKATSVTSDLNREAFFDLLDLAQKVL
jgi:proteasome assembly chaperone 3